MTIILSALFSLAIAVVFVLIGIIILSFIIYSICLLFTLISKLVIIVYDYCSTW